MRGLSPPAAVARAADTPWINFRTRLQIVNAPHAVPDFKPGGIAAEENTADPLTERTTLKELVGVIAEARALVTNDSGPMHVAAAVGTPVVAIFGPTNPRRTGPYGAGHRVLSGRAPCSPCYRRQCIHGGGDAIACMTRISAEEVADLLRDAWLADREIPRVAAGGSARRGSGA